MPDRDDPNIDASRTPVDSHVDRGDYEHHTVHRDDGSRMSWNTDRDGGYIQGSGHTSDSKGKVSRWDKGEQDHRR